MPLLSSAITAPMLPVNTSAPSLHEGQYLIHQNSILADDSPQRLRLALLCAVTPAGRDTVCSYAQLRAFHAASQPGRDSSTLRCKTTVCRAFDVPASEPCETQLARPPLAASPHSSATSRATQRCSNPSCQDRDETLPDVPVIVENMHGASAASTAQVCDSETVSAVSVTGPRSLRPPYLVRHARASSGVACTASSHDPVRPHRSAGADDVRTYEHEYCAGLLTASQQQACVLKNHSAGRTQVWNAQSGVHRCAACPGTRRVGGARTANGQAAVESPRSRVSSAVRPAPCTRGPLNGAGVRPLGPARRMRRGFTHLEVGYRSATVRRTSVRITT